MALYNVNACAAIVENGEAFLCLKSSDCHFGLNRHVNGLWKALIAAAAEYIFVLKW